MKVGKAPGPSGIVLETIRAAGDKVPPRSAIICDGKVNSDWEQSFIVCLYKGKGDALERGKYCCLKLTEQVMNDTESPGEDCRWPHQTVGVNGQFPVASSKVEAQQTQSLLSSSCK